MWLLRSISLPHFAHHRARTALTLLGVALGVAAMVATTGATGAVFRSFRHGVEATAGRADVQLTNAGGGVAEGIATEALAVPGVAVAAPLVAGFVPLARAASDVLAIFGLDLLADHEHEAQLPRAAVEIPDEVLFVSRPDSVALGRSFAEARGLSLGSTFDVLAPEGIRTLVVRGLVDPIGPASLFGGAVGLMDIPGAQRLLAKGDRVDRIDVRLLEGAARAETLAVLRARVGDRAQLEEVAVHGARAEDLLQSFKVMLSIAALVAVVVGFFLIHHTMSVSILQRRKEIAVLNALGVSRRAILGWLASEAAVLGTLAGLLGYGLGIAIARLSMSSISAVTSAFMWTPPPEAPVSWGDLGVALGVALASTEAATLLAARSVVVGSASRFLHLAPASAPARTRMAVAFGAMGLAVTVVLVRFAPVTLPYRWLILFIFMLNSLALVSCALLSPVVTLALGRLVVSAAGRVRGPSLLLAGRSIVREPVRTVAVVSAIVLGLGWTLADASLFASFRGSWLDWVDTQYRSDLIVSADATTLSFLTAPPLSDDIVPVLRAVPGVHDVQGVRVIDITYEGHAAAVQAFDPSPLGPDLLDGTWEAVAPAFWAGAGVAVSYQLAHLRGLTKGDVVSLQTPRGERRFPVLGVFTDFRVAYVGSIAISRTAYEAAWGDGLVNTVRVWVEPGADVATVRGAIQSRLGRTRGLYAVTAGEFRLAVHERMEQVFALQYAIVVIALLVAGVGVTNFLLSAVLDRQPELRSLSACGVSTGDIRLAIVIEGALLGVVGATIGLIAGVVVARLIVVHSVPMVNGWLFAFRFPTGYALRLAASVILLAAGAGILPARAATRRHVIHMGIPE